ncbi:MAG: glycosyltransferase [Vicinamibacteria bacterium]|nr:glycosyltransferase [Vicinamibacteria bacterium]
MRRRVDQWVPALHRGDAIGDSALLMRDALRSWGFVSDIYAYNQDPGVSAVPFQHWREGDADDIVLFHYALISPMNDAFAKTASRRVLQYHNITPPHFFASWDKEIYKILAQGRQGLAALGPVTTLALGDSEFNRAELQSQGFEKTGVLPIALDFRRYSKPANAALKRRLADSRTNILFVGRIAPNKRHDNLLRVLAYFKKNISSAVRLLAVGKHPRRETGVGAPIEAHYLDALTRLYSDLGVEPQDVVFTDGVPHEDLLAYYESAHVFVSMSEHEGFGVPLVEAMLKQVPIVALSGTAVGETLGEAGLQFARPDIVEFAEAAALLSKPGRARETILRGQKRRVQDFATETTLGKLRDLVSQL